MTVVTSRQSTVRPERREAASTGGFTLVELLVVIGIIALLISILLPSLNRAREAAKTVQCASNMRQVGQAFYLYASQQKGWLPPAVSAGWYGPYMPNGTTSKTWVDLLLETKNFKAGDGKFTGGLVWLNDYTVPILNCPNVYKNPWDGTYITTWSYNVPYDIFGCDGAVGTRRPSKLSELNSASQVITLVESTSACPAFYAFVRDSDGGGGPSPDWYGWDVRHDKRSNFLMADGHVGAYTFNGPIIRQATWCFRENWENEVENNLFDSRAALGLQQNW